MDAPRLASEARRCNVAAREAARAWMLARGILAGTQAGDMLRDAIRDCMDASGAIREELESRLPREMPDDEERLERVREGMWANG